MKHSIPQSKLRTGFTLVEILVATAITVILVGVLVYLTAISADTYTDSRDRVRAARQAKEALDTLAKDFESMVLRRDGNAHEWFYAGAETSSLKGPTVDKEIPNTSRIIFFTGATDRYNGQIGTAQDNGGDVSAVSYRLVYKDQISGGPPAQEGAYPVFSMYRHLVNPDEAFDILAVDNLETGSTTVFSDTKDLVAENFLVENIYEFTVTLNVQVDTNPVGGGVSSQIVRVTLSPSACDEFRVRGNGFEYTGTIDLPTGVTADDVRQNGKLLGAEISITVLTDQGLVQAQRSGISREELIKKHGHHFTKSISLPRL